MQSEPLCAPVAQPQLRPTTTATSSARALKPGRFCSSATRAALTRLIVSGRIRSSRDHMDAVNRVNDGRGQARGRSPARATFSRWSRALSGRESVRDGCTVGLERRTVDELENPLELSHAFSWSPGRQHHPGEAAEPADTAQPQHLQYAPCVRSTCAICGRLAANPRPDVHEPLPVCGFVDAGWDGKPGKQVFGQQLRG